jgi:hypothetical protein
MEFIKENGLEKIKTFESASEASWYGKNYSDQHHTIVPSVNKDSLQPETKQLIEKKIGKFLLVQDGPDEYEKSNKFFAVSRGKDGDYKSIEIHPASDGWDLTIEGGFSKVFDAHQSMWEKYKTEEKALSPYRGMER